MSFRAALRMYGLQSRGIARRDDQSVRAIAQGFLEERDVSLPETWIAPEIDVQRRGEWRRRLADALAERVPEERDLPRQVDRNAKLFARLQVAGREVRAVAERFGHAQDARPRHRVHAGLGVKRAIDGAGGDRPSARAMSLMPTGCAGAVGFLASEDMRWPILPKFVSGGGYRATLSVTTATECAGSVEDEAVSRLDRLARDPHGVRRRESVDGT